jgi:hypothetical protein
MKVARADLPPNLRAFVDGVLDLAKTQGLHGTVTIERTGGERVEHWVMIRIPEEEPSGKAK